MAAVHAGKVPNIYFLMLQLYYVFLLSLYRKRKPIKCTLDNLRSVVFE